MARENSIFKLQVTERIKFLIIKGVFRSFSLNISLNLLTNFLSSNFDENDKCFGKFLVTFPARNS